MRSYASGLRNSGAFLRRNRVGGIAFFCLYSFGAFFGHALLLALYPAEAAIWTVRLYPLSGSLPLASILLYAAVPAFLYICCMLLCAYSRRALPLWGLCQLAAGFRAGFAVAILRGLEMPWTSLMLLPLFIGQAALSLLSLDAGRAPDPDAYRVMERLLAPSTAYLIAVSVTQLLITVLLTRGA